jgi:hypothetical protein
MTSGMVKTLRIKMDNPRVKYLNLLWLGHGTPATTKWSINDPRTPANNESLAN